MRWTRSMVLQFDYIEHLCYNKNIKKSTVIELPGYVTVAGAADQLRLAARSVRDLIYTGRLPSARLGRRHFLRIPDVEAERRRRLGLPLPPSHTVPTYRRVVRRPPAPPRASNGWTIQSGAIGPVRSDA